MPDRHLVLVANGSASGLGHSRAVLDGVRHALRASGAGIETHLTESVEQLSAEWPDFQDRRVVLLGGDGTLHSLGGEYAGNELREVSPDLGRVLEVHARHHHQAEPPIRDKPQRIISSHRRRSETEEPCTA